MRIPVDYEALEAVCEQARDANPDALDVTPIWYAGRPLAEVWTERNRAHVYDPEGR